MEPLLHSQAAEGVSAQVIANATRGLAGGTTASAAVAALVPAGVDEVSALAAMSFASEGIEAMATNSFAQEELARAGGAIAEISGIYNAVDAAQATTL